MKPTFLDCPPRYTRTRRTATSDIDLGCAVERVRPTGYGALWWAVITLIALAGLLVIVAFGPGAV